MSAGAISRTRTAARVPRWSSTGQAGARPDTCPALDSTPRESPKRIVGGPEQTHIRLITMRDHSCPIPRRCATDLIAAIKSP